VGTVSEVDAKIDAHVDVCAVRYEGIEVQMRGMNARLKRLETILISVAGAMLLMLLHLVIK
jgi:hypothetical protein